MNHLKPWIAAGILVLLPAIAFWLARKDSGSQATSVSSVVSNPTEIFQPLEKTVAPEDEFIPPRESGEVPPVETKPMELRSVETGELCRRLMDMAGEGESFETIAISSELVRRSDDAVTELEPMLQSGRREIEIAAMRILTRIGTPRAVAAAIVRLCMEPESDAQADLMKTFGNARSRMVADAVVVMAAAETRPEYQDNLKAVLSAMEGSEIVTALADRIRAEESDEALRPWLEILSALSKPSNVQELENLMLDDNREPVQRAAADALAGIGDSRACWILAGYGTDIPQCRDALAQVRSPYARTALREIAASDLDAEVRAAAQKALEHYAE
ncbi:MAG: HEAT repeat domain-containing protein [Kiritimatiellia bacterium]